jgi:type IX secretion system PorP/SprF family membrane protein
MRKLLLGLTLLLCMQSSWAQDNVYSQYLTAPLLLNPALTGITSNPRFTSNYRAQWTELPTAYSTYSVSYDQFVDKLNSGFGVSLMSDVQGNGIYKNLFLTGTYAYNVQAADNLFFRGGVDVSYVNTRLDWDRLVFIDQLDPLTGSTDGAGNTNPSNEVRPLNTNANYLDIGVGLMAFSEYWYAGVSLKHLNAPSVSLLRDRQNRGVIPMRVTFNAGGEFPLNPRNKVGTHPFISPNVLYTRQAGMNQINVGTQIGYGSVFAGLWYRSVFSANFANSDAAILSLGYRKGVFRLGYSYDLTVSGLSPSTGGAHEVSLIINLDESEKAKKKRNARRFENCLKIFR